MTTFTTIIRKDTIGYKGGVQSKVDGRVIWSEYSPYHAFSRELAKADAEQVLENHLSVSKL